MRPLNPVLRAIAEAIGAISIFIIAYGFVDVMDQLINLIWQ